MLLLAEQFSLINTVILCHLWYHPSLPLLDAKTESIGAPFSRQEVANSGDTINRLKYQLKNTDFVLFYAVFKVFGSYANDPVSVGHIGKSINDCV